MLDACCGTGALARKLATKGRQVVGVDFAAPMPWNIARVRNWGMELAAGWQHFSAFRAFTRGGGLGPLVTQAGAEIESERFIDAATMHVLVVRERPGAGSKSQGPRPRA